MHEEKKEITPEEEDCENSSTSDENQETETIAKESLFRNWPLMSAITVYCLVSLHNMAYTEIFSLWAESDKKYGGLGFSTRDVGEVLAISGSSLLVFQLFFYRPVERLFGPITSARTASFISIPVLFVYPYFTHLSGATLKLMVNAASVVKNVLSVIILTGLFILQNNAVDQHQRGAANGISMTAMSFFKAVAPASAGVIFSWAQKRQSASFLPGDQLVFFLLNMVQFLAMIMTFKPFLQTRNK